MMLNNGPVFSVIIPVYNRPGEMEELLESILMQQGIDPNEIEVIVVEDGSSVPCGNLCEHYKWKGLNVKYLYKTNEGRSIARNRGIEMSKGEWMIFFDSDCIIPEDYFYRLKNDKTLLVTDCFGGPDAAHQSFSSVQKAISFAMTSFLTTGGIRGSRNSIEKFVPRSFNMGFRREVYEKVGGFREMYSEDIDMSTRIKNAGFRVVLLPDQKVYHKRRVNFCKFFRQVYVFGKSRITLHFLYPGSLKIVHTLPALFVVASALMIFGGLFLSVWSLLPLAIFMLLLFTVALWEGNSLKVAFLAVPAGLIQLWGYGLGFINAFFYKVILRKGRNIEEEIEDRKGK